MSNHSDVLLQANIVLQIHKSHLERVVDFICGTFLSNTLIDHDASASSDGISYFSNIARPDATEADSERTPCVNIIATKRLTLSRSSSLLFVYAADEKSFLEYFFSKYTFVQKAINKVYVLLNDRSIVRGVISAIDPEKKSDFRTNGLSICHHLLGLMQNLKHSKDDDKLMAGATENLSLVKKTDGPTVVMEKRVQDSQPRRSVIAKVEVFPPRLQHQVVQCLNALLVANSIPEDEVDISPVNQTHTLTILQIDTPSCDQLGFDRNGSNNQRGTFIIGISPFARKFPLMPAISDSSSICRAFYKLAEAFERFGGSDARTSPKKCWAFPNLGSGSKRCNAESQPILAVDCGAAPGGWTKYLLDETFCDEVYAIDPGDMAETITSRPNVHHLKMTAAKAIPKIREIMTRLNASISIWVSDMCVQDISMQVDMFLRAHKEGILKPDSAFVLTIKCNVGHAKERFDELTQREVNRLKELGVYDLKVLHLFSNRNGERTVMGFVK